MAVKNVRKIPAWESKINPLFVFHKFCACSGTAKWKYKWKEKLLELHVTKTSYRVFLRARPHSKGQTINMEQELKQYND